MTCADRSAIDTYMYEQMKDSAYDRHHVSRVLDLALDIAECEPDADTDILTAAALLHDIGRGKQFENPEICHAAAGGEMAEAFLLSLGWPEERAAHVRACIASHKYQGAAKPETIEAKILFDADKLDVCGAIGIARTLLYAGQIGDPLYRRGMWDKIITGGGGDESSSFIEEYHYKLKRMYDGFYTGRAKEIGAERRKTAEGFYNGLAKELGMPKPKITCIGHSGFLVELPGVNLIFDYYTDKKDIITPGLFKNKTTCVFVSHNHADHYNKEIFNWRGYGQVFYILDKDCDTHGMGEVIKVRDDKIIFITGQIRAKAFGSTDEGVSFLVNASGCTVFHAGDLNDWYWEDESTREELAADEERYLGIIRGLENADIDVAFIPRDPRLGRNADRGIRFFEEIVKPARIIPMHFPGNDGTDYSEQ
ncbi:MAG: MBL fold metallo-hydrolase [Clostridiales bacterium]|jgi:uncharacterized protein|nr:MBL fold metallo-hydrolase [Clostridiales bacterium]